MHYNVIYVSGESPEPMFQPNTDYPVLVSPSEEPDRSVLVIQTHSYGKYLGRLNVQFDEAGEISSYDGNPILLDESVAKGKFISNGNDIKVVVRITNMLT